VFGRQPVVEASLDDVRDDTLRDGDPPGWMNGIPAYSLWWLVVQHEWYLHHGAAAYLEGQRPYLRKLLPRVFDHLDDAGRERFDGWRFLDWATGYDDAAVHAGFQGLTAWALAAAAELCAALGEHALRDRCAAARGRMTGDASPAGDSQQAWALLVLGGLADPAAANRGVLGRGAAPGLTPFLGYHVLEARARAGDVAGGLRLVRDYWGRMLDLGATTFWEDFDLAWAANAAGIDELTDVDHDDIHADFGRCAASGLSLSLCHGWSAGPTAWLSRHVLGVRPLEPGCRAVEVRPDLGDLHWAEGAVPTPLGPVRVRHRRQPDGTVHSAAEAPAGVRLVGAE
jgi:hypothetical protein